MCDGLSWTVSNSNDECLVTKTCDDKIEQKKHGTAFHVWFCLLFYKVIKLSKSKHGKIGQIYTVNLRSEAFESLMPSP